MKKNQKKNFKNCLLGCLLISGFLATITVSAGNEGEDDPTTKNTATTTATTTTPPAQTATTTTATVGPTPPPTTTVRVATEPTVRPTVPPAPTTRQQPQFVASPPTTFKVNPFVPLTRTRYTGSAPIHTDPNALGKVSSRVSVTGFAGRRRLPPPPTAQYQRPTAFAPLTIKRVDPPPMPDYDLFTRYHEHIAEEVRAVPKKSQAKPSFIKIDSILNPEVSRQPQFNSADHLIENDCFMLQASKIETEPPVPPELDQALAQLTSDQHETHVDEPIILRKNCALVGKGNLANRPKLSFADLTVKDGSTVRLENVDLFGKIKVNSSAHLVLVNCTVNGNTGTANRETPLDCCIDLTGCAKLQCQNVEFANPNDSLTTYVGIRNCSTGEFDHCNFLDANRAGLISLHSSVALVDSNFSRNKSRGIELNQGSYGNLQNCNFDNNGQDLFIRDHSEVVADRMHSVKSIGAVTVGDLSNLKLTNSTITESKRIGILVLKDSTANCGHDHFENCNSSVQFINSTGFLQDVSATGSIPLIPTILISGNHSNVAINESLFSNEKGPALVIHDFATPHFQNTTFQSSSKSSGIRISDFARPSFADCEFIISSPVAIRLERAARAVINNSYFSIQPGQVVFHFASQGKLATTPDSNQFSIPVNFDCAKLNGAVVEPTSKENKFTFKLMPNLIVNKPTESPLLPSKHKRVFDFDIKQTIQEMRGDVPHHDHRGEFVIPNCGHLISAAQAHEIEPRLKAKSAPLAYCPVCNEIARSTNEIRGEEICPVCREEVPDSLLPACGHTLCAQCAAKCSSLNDHSANGFCPTCRKTLIHFVVMDFDQTHDCDVAACNLDSEGQDQDFEVDETVEEQTEPDQTAPEQTRDQHENQPEEGAEPEVSETNNSELRF